MKDLLAELVPHAPQMGLYAVPHIPPDKLQAAVRDYAPGVNPAEVLALYDATLMGSAKDGALFTAERFVFQNNDLESPQVVRYSDLVKVEYKKKLLGGARVKMNVNRGRATFDLSMDFSGRPEAADYVARFLHEAMLRGAAAEMERTPSEADTETDVGAVDAALRRLRDARRLSASDYQALMATLRREG